jgi:hypothetical protein
MSAVRLSESEPALCDTHTVGPPGQPTAAKRVALFQIDTTNQGDDTMTENDQHRNACVGVCDSIMQRLGSREVKWSDDEYRDLYRTLRDIEDRLCRQGEYHPSNVAALPKIRLSMTPTPRRSYAGM